MKAIGLMLLASMVLTSALSRTAEAQIVYTQVNVAIPVGGSYNLDVNGDGVIDYVLQSKFLQEYCQSGDEFSWRLTAIPAGGNDVVTSLNQAGSDYASALPYDAPVNSSQNLYPGSATMAELYWGACGIGMLGEWLNQPTRYLGLQFQAADGIHYGWAKLSTVAYVDQDQHLHASTLLSGFAYEVTPGAGILAGNTGTGTP